MPKFRYSVTAAYDEDANEIQLLEIEREQALSDGEILELETKYPQRYWMVDDLNQIEEKVTVRLPRYAEIYIRDGQEEPSGNVTERDKDLRVDYGTKTNEEKSHYLATDWYLRRSELRSDEAGNYWALILESALS